jgi:hypothetical protein
VVNDDDDECVLKKLTNFLDVTNFTGQSELAVTKQIKYTQMVIENITKIYINEKMPLEDE